MSKTIRTIQTTQNGALIIFNACNSPKVFTETLDLANAHAIVKLVEKKVPDVRKLHDVPASQQEAWLARPVTLKFSESIFETAKKGIDSLRSQGMLTGNAAVYDLLTVFGLIKDHDIEELLALNADTMEAVPGAAGAAEAKG